ncbi:MAG: hypothetical protein ACYDA3_03235 [Gaiellaceae bacterium]
MLKRALFASWLSALAFASLAAASPGVGSGPFVVGATEDAAVYADDGGAMFQQMHSYGFGAIRMSVFWDGGSTFSDEAGLQRAIGQAVREGIRPILSIAPAQGHGNAISSPSGPGNLASFAVQVAQSFPQVQDIIVGNEPNLQRFNGPSWNGSVPVGAWNYERALAAAYDALHQFNPNIDVIGIATSPRGNFPTATSNVGIPPVKFIAGVGAAYKASARAEPIADNVAFHPYPNPNSANDPPAKGYQWPNAGVPNLDRLQQAWWDAFNGTAQPLFLEDGVHTSSDAGRSVKWVLDEAGWQVTTTLPGYTGKENWKTVSEATQAKYYGQLVTSFSCDSSRVAGLLFFHWIDESDRGSGFQSGFRRIDGSIRPAAGTVHSAVSAGCTGQRTTWSHTSGVEGATATFHPKGGLAFFFGAQEDVRYTASISAAGVKLAQAAGDLKAYWTAGVPLPAGPRARGRGQALAATVTLTSVQNPSRSVTFNSRLVKG